MDKALSVVLVMAVAGAVGMLGYVMVAPKTGERFTEFYILGAEGRAADYPKELAIGEEGRGIIGIANHEHAPVTYRVEVAINGVENSESAPIELDHDEKHERIIAFTPNEPGMNQKVEFLLYRDGDVEPLLEPIHLWINVAQ